MPRRSKDTLANTEYGFDFDELEPGEKAAITKKYNAQVTPRKRKAKASAAGVTATLGRIGVNGTQTCILEKGSDVDDLIDQAGFDFDEDKESVSALSTGEAVDMDTTVVNGETYMISPEIKSA